MADLDLDAIEARADAATSGPWYQGQDARYYESAGEAWTREDMSNRDSCDLFPIAANAQDAEFVAHSRKDVPALIAEVRRLSQRPVADDIARIIDRYVHPLVAAEAVLALFPMVRSGDTRG